jgi:hypothetical protein
MLPSEQDQFLPVRLREAQADGRDLGPADIDKLMVGDAHLLDPVGHVGEIVGLAGMETGFDADSVEQIIVVLLQQPQLAAESDEVLLEFPGELEGVLVGVEQLAHAPMLAIFLSSKRAEF